MNQLISKLLKDIIKAAEANLEAVQLLTGLFFISTAVSCTPNTFVAFGPLP